MGYQKLSYSDYYAFGMQMPSRTYTPSDSYKYGFNGMEKDGELSGEGNSYTTQFRQYDPRIGRWFSTDPQEGHPSLVGWSTYSFSYNNPILFIDPEGDKKSFSSEISGLQNFKDVTVYGQTNSAFPSMYTNYRDDKGRGDNHSLYVLDKIVMIQPKNTLDRAPVMPSMIDCVNSTYKVQKTYMVGGYGRSQDWNLNEQNVALPMRKSKNGWGTVGTSQTGDTKP